MDEEKKAESFSVKDKRRFAAGDEGEVKTADDSQAEEKNKSPEPPGPEKEAAESEGQTTRDAQEEQVPFPEIDFSTFILSLSSSAVLHLGLMENPYTKKIERNIPLAKQTIDIIAMLKEKSKGNLTNEEDNLITNLLTDLRLKYVNEIKGK